MSATKAMLTLYLEAQTATEADVLAGTEGKLVTADVIAPLLGVAVPNEVVEAAVEQYFIDNPASGDVVGPSSSTNDRIAVFSGTSGKVIKQGPALGDGALLDVGTDANTLAAGDDERITGALQADQNLSDLASPSAARENLGLEIGVDVPANDDQRFDRVMTPDLAEPDVTEALADAVAAPGRLRIDGGEYVLTDDVTVSDQDGRIEIDPSASFTGGLLDLDGLVPRQTNPLFGLDLTRKTYGPEFADYANVYQFGHSAIIEADGPMRAVALYGFGESKVSGKSAWGSNIVAIASATGAIAIGLELDVGVTASGGLGYGIAVAATGSYPVQAAYTIQGNNPGATFVEGILFDNSPVQIVTGTLIKSTGTAAQRGIYFTGAFSSAEYESPSFRVGATPASINSQVEVLGSAAGQVQVRARGTGTSPATDADLILRSLGTKDVLIRSGDNTSKIRANNTGLGFYGTAPIAKPTFAAALPTDGSATSAQLATAFNSLRTALTSLGLGS